MNGDLLLIMDGCQTHTYKMGVRNVLSIHIRYIPTTTSHTRYTSHVVHACFSVDREIITHVPTNSHACKTRVIPTRAVLTRVPYIFSLIGVRAKTTNTVL